MGTTKQTTHSGDFHVTGKIIADRGIESDDLSQFKKEIATAAAASTVKSVQTDAAIAAAAEAAEEAAALAELPVLTLSASSVSRNRARELTPSTLTISAATPRGVAYTGIFTIELSQDTLNYTTVYTSPENENTYTYTIPATMEIEGTTYYVASIRISLYKAGDTTTLYDQEYVSVIKDTSVAAMYLGRTFEAHPGEYVDGDSWLVYGDDDATVLRGVYYSNDGTPTRISAISGQTGYTTDSELLAKLQGAFLDISWVIKNGYGTADTYGITTYYESIAAVAAFIDALYVTHLNGADGTFSGSLSATTITAESALYSSDGHVALYGDATENTFGEGLCFADYDMKNSSPASGDNMGCMSLFSDGTYSGVSLKTKIYKSSWDSGINGALIMSGVATDPYTFNVELWANALSDVSNFANTYLGIYASVSGSTVRSWIDLSVQKTVSGTASQYGIRFDAAGPVFYPTNDNATKLGDDSFKWKSLYLGTGGVVVDSSMKITTDYGYVNIGPTNTSWCHFTTDRAGFYFGTKLAIAGRIYPYADNTYTCGLSTNRFSKVWGMEFVSSSTSTSSTTFATWFTPALGESGLIVCDDGAAGGTNGGLWLYTRVSSGLAFTMLAGSVWYINNSGTAVTIKSASASYAMQFRRLILVSA